MAILKIRYLPDEVLRQVAKPVTVFDDALQTLIDDMFETMYSVNGVGLAAPQVGVSLRLSVIDVKGDKSEQIVIINPEITEREGEAIYEEGCLSVPGAYQKVKRAKAVSISALDRLGNPFTQKADGLLGECFQHEIDHLNGKLFVDLLSPLKRNKARKQMDKYLRSK